MGPSQKGVSRLKSRLKIVFLGEVAGELHRADGELIRHGEVQPELAQLHAAEPVGMELPDDVECVSFTSNVGAGSSMELDLPW